MNPRSVDQMVIEFAWRRLGDESGSGAIRRFLTSIYLPLLFVLGSCVLFLT